MKLLKMLTCTAASALFLFGCTTVQEMPAEKVSQECNTPELKLCRELLIAFIKNDASGFVNRLTPENQKSFNKEDFTTARNNMLKTVGEPVSFRYLTSPEFVKLQPHVWIVRFKRKDLAQKQEFFSEALFRIVTGRDKNGNIYVLGFNFL
ncbi:MAG: hypothetical protein IKB16_14320 [Lentisphaeria bacterium]|nr:hypothetical protein [Lentisphaeria bacterium]